MKHQIRRSFRIERLEARAMMAGNITAQRVGDDLIISGDNFSNNLSVDWIGVDTYALVGKHADAATEDTTINGSMGIANFNGISGNIVIRLNDGDDGLFLKKNGSMVVKEALILDMGAGNDVISTAAPGVLRVGTELIADLGAGNDYLQHWNGSSGGSTIIDAGSGYDLVTLVGLVMERDFVIRGGADSDNLQCSRPTVRGYTLYDGGDGADLMGIFAGALGQQAAFLAGAGADRIALSFSRFDSGVLCDQGAQFGNTELGGCIVQQVYILGQGPHQIALFEVQGKRLELGLAESSDTVQIDSSVLDNVFAALGSGDDQFVIRNSVVQGICSVAAGPGFDSLLSEGNLFGQASFVDFEVPTSLARTIRPIG